MGEGVLWQALLLLWLCGAALRLTILAVPAVITELQADLGLSGTQIGILSGLPVIVFGVFAVPGSIVIARLGIVSAIVIGLVIAATGSALRGAFSSLLVLYAMTVLMAAGIAMLQVALPAAMRAWTPQRIVFATAVYTNGLLFGEIFPVALTQPLLMPWVGSSWEWAFVIWSTPLLFIALWVGATAPRAVAASAAAGIAWWPDWRSRVVWRMALIFASVTGTYFAANTFLPPYLSERGRPDLITAALTALNVGQLPASFLLLAFSSRMERRIWPYLGFGLLTLVCVVGLVLSASLWTVAWAAVLGFALAGALTLCLTLPALLSAPQDVARAAAGMFTISYALSVIISVASGAAWDVGGSAVFAFLPIAVGVLPLLLLSPGIPFGRAGRKFRD